MNTLNPYKRHIMEITKDQEKQAQILLNKYKESIQPKDVKLFEGGLGSHWTHIFRELWEQRLNNNAKCTQHLKEIFHNEKHSLNLRVKHLNLLYSDIIRKLNYYEDLAYSNHYILQLHFQYICESIDTSDPNCLKHSDIEEYKDIEMTIEECFCNSLFNKPKFCSYCRNPTFFNYTFINDENLICSKTNELQL